MLTCFLRTILYHNLIHTTHLNQRQSLLKDLGLACDCAKVQTLGINSAYQRKMPVNTFVVSCTPATVLSKPFYTLLSRPEATNQIDTSALL